MATQDVWGVVSCSHGPLPRSVLASMGTMGQATGKGKPER